MQIKQKPHRIVWLFKRWQPLYDDIKKCVVPNVEFVRGIPTYLESDEYFDPRQRNLIVLDDLMSTAAKDTRINDLFTEGSHHRNLSVIALNQNLFFGKDPTQRRNCHYLALFKNPIDKQQIATLGRQMYPAKPGYLVREFDEATENPWGYLLVDLKPTTPDIARLRPNVLTGEDEKSKKELKHDDKVMKEDSEEEKMENNDGVIREGEEEAIKEDSEEENMEDSEEDIREDSEEEEEEEEEDSEDENMEDSEEEEEEEGVLQENV